MKVLFLVPYPTEGASNRVRVEQFIPYLESRGVACKVRPFVNRRFFRILYMPHRIPEKAFWFILCTLNRMLDVVRALGYDIIFIHREAYPLGGAVIESALRRMGKALVFDFDDAIFLPNTSEHNIYIERFKRPGKTTKIIGMSSRVIAGNEYLKEYALRHNANAHLVPSSVDTDKYRPGQAGPDRQEVVIGWIGSDTTKRFLYDLEDVFAELSKRYKNISYKIIGAPFYSSRLTNLVNKKWSLEGEVSDLQGLDIGIMPMPDNEWTKGKCGFKALLYMACGIPVVTSPVGANLGIVEDGVSGYFANTREEWFKHLSRLIEDRNLRKTMGLRGRDKVIREYSLKNAEPVLYDILTMAGRQNAPKG